MDTDSRQLEWVREQETTTALIRDELNNFVDFKDSLLIIIKHLRVFASMEAVGIRLHNAGDYPYYVYDGFAEGFILRENSLCVRDGNGKRIAEPDGNGYLLECMCGNIIRGRFDPSLSFFTAAGSFWTNSTTELLASLSEDERQGKTRNCCNAHGYQSVALVPLKFHGEQIGLIQFNDTRPDRLNHRLIEYIETISELIGIAVQNSHTFTMIQEKEALAWALFEYNPIQTVVVDREGRVTMFNWAKRDSGMRQPSIGDLMYQDYAGRHEHNMRGELMECMDSGVAKEFQELKYDDKYLAINIAAFPHGAIITSQDITKIKHTELELLQRSQELKRRLNELDCLYRISDIIQMESGSIEDVFLPILNVVVSAYQYPEIAVARIWFAGKEYRTEHFHESYWRQACEIDNLGAIEVYYLEERQGIDEGPFLHGERRFIQATAARLRRFMERKQAQAALSESEQRFKSIAETIEEVFWIADAEIQQMIYVSPGYERVWGRTVSSLYENSKSFMDAIVPEDRERVIHMFKLKDSRQVFDVEYRIIRHDGSMRWIRDRGFPDSQSNYYVGVASDITERKNAEDALKEAYDKVESAHEELVSTRHSERLAFTGRIAASIAHEIRNPSTNVSLALRQLSQTFEPQGTQKEYVDIIEKNITRINSLITELLNCARPPELNMEQQNIHELLEDVIESLATKMRVQKITLFKNFIADPAILKVDKKHIERALLNLILNAIEAIPRNGGVLTIATESNQKNLLIKIADTGKGIAEENIIKIFDPFFSSKPNGVGLGLTTCYGVIVSHGGTIEVESKQSKGSLFTVVLPVT